MKKVSLILTILVLCMAMVGAACAETVQPNPVTIDFSKLDDRYVTADIKYADGKVSLELYELECFDKEAIEGLKAGDVLETDGKQITVETAAPDGETGDFYINKDTDSQLLLCLNTLTGCYEVNYPEEDDRVPFISIGTLENVELDAYTVFLDASDPEAELPTMYNGTDLLKKLQDPNEAAFDVKNIKVLFGIDNQPVLIWRYYSVAQ